MPLVILPTLLVLLASAGPAGPQSNQAYVGSDACRPCHGAYLNAWAATKHARTFDKLAPADRDNPACVGCHVTGSPEIKAAGGNAPSFPAVQCEACHGPGATHVAQARAKAIDRAALVGRPDEAACTRCHNSGSPHFKPFYYAAMKGLVHMVKK
jgi:hypothetical protein